MTSKKVVIVGGGISGLAAAHRLEELGRGRWEITLLEGSPRFGGVIETVIQDGFLMEAGPDCFLTKKKAGINLCEQLGLQDELLETRSDFRRSFIVRKNKMRRVPQGFYLIAPTQTSTLFKMPLLSLYGKMRAACDLVIPKRKATQDESLGTFITRRFGKEVLQRIGQPMIGGIYSGDPSKISLRATMPHFHHMEERYGSVLKALRQEKSQGFEPSSGPRYNLFLSLNSGMEVLIRTLVQSLKKTQLIHSARVVKISRGRSWEVSCADQKRFEADALILAVPSYAAAKLLENVDPVLSRELAGIQYESVATANFVFHKKDVPHDLDGFGFVVPALEKTSLSACTFSHVKFPYRAPDDFVLLRGFMGGAMYPGMIDLDERELEKRARYDLKNILGITAPPLRVMIRKYHRAMPQYEVGHLIRTAEIEHKASVSPGLFLTGNAYHGIGIPDCIDQAEKKAEAVSAYFERLAQERHTS